MSVSVKVLSQKRMSRLRAYLVAAILALGLWSIYRFSSLDWFVFALCVVVAAGVTQDR